MHDGGFKAYCLPTSVELRVPRYLLTHHFRPNFSAVAWNQAPDLETTFLIMPVRTRWHHETIYDILDEGKVNESCDAALSLLVCVVDCFYLRESGMRQ